MRYFDDVVCELHALEGHGLPLYTRAWAINKSLPIHSATILQTVESKLKITSAGCRTSTHPILVDDIYNGHQLASMGSEREVGNTANLNEAFEHLNKTPDKHQNLTRLQGS